MTDLRDRLCAICAPTGMAVFALVAVASLAVPVLDAVRRWVR